MWKGNGITNEGTEMIANELLKNNTTFTEVNLGGDSVFGMYTETKHW